MICDYGRGKPCRNPQPRTLARVLRRRDTYLAHCSHVEVLRDCTGAHAARRLTRLRTNGAAIAVVGQTEGATNGNWRVRRAPRARGGPAKYRASQPSASSACGCARGQWVAL